MKNLAAEEESVAPTTTSALVIHQLFGVNNDAGSSKAGQRSTHLAVPNGSHPQMYLPCPDRSTVWRAATAYNRLRTYRRQLARLGAGASASLLLSSRFAVGDAVTIGDDARSLLAQIEREVGVGPLQYAIGTPKLDAWWKPTLQLFDRASRPAGYAKIGYTPLTRSMVAVEAQALERLAIAPPITFRAPAPIANFQVDDLTVSISAPMPSNVRRGGRNFSPSADLLAEMAAFAPAVPAGAAGTGSEPRPDGLHNWWSRLSDVCNARTQSSLPAGVGEIAIRLAAVVERCKVAAARSGLRGGSWHGDLVPWNLALQRVRSGSTDVWVWDWEYSSAQVPVGLDARHWWFQIAHVEGGRSVRDALLYADTSAMTMLDALNVAPKDRSLLSLCHAIELAARHVRAVHLGAPPHDDLVGLVEFAERWFDLAGAPA